jgi:diaminopimelate epimerase
MLVRAEIMENNGIPFSKASACGNDFLILEGKFAPTRIEEFTRLICDRHEGVGADGVEWVYFPSDASPAPAAGEQDFDLRISLINADGSHAELSGNGTRSVAAWYAAQHLPANGAELGVPGTRRGCAHWGGAGSKTEVVRIATDAGVKTCELIAQNGREFTFRTAMGCPRVGEAISIPVQGRTISGVPVAMGNPQFLIFVDEFPRDWQQIAAEVQSHIEHFPEGVNVEFVQLRSASEIAIRIFERGVGETSSSGTGSSASAAAAIAVKGLESRLEVHAPGGSQVVEWNGPQGKGDHELYLTGPARLICRGEFLV